MPTSRTLAALIILIGTAACNPFRQEQAVQVSADDAALNSRWHGTLASPSALAGIVQMTGSATMSPDRGDGTIVTLDLANASPGGRHLWAARAGQCGDGMDVEAFGRADAYETLTVGDDGRAQGRAALQVRTPESGRYFVAVYASEANARTVVACGNLAAPTR